MKTVKSVSRTVEDLISDYSLLEDYLSRGLINQSALARELMPRIEQLTKEKVTPQSVIMAIKRYKPNITQSKVDGEVRKVISNCTVNLKSGIADISLERVDNIFVLLNELSKKVKYQKGEVLSVIQGISETAIIVDEKYVEDVLKKIDKKNILKIERNLVELHIMAPPEFWVVPSIIYHFTKKLAEHSINVVDIVTTLTEMSMLVYKKDASKAFESISGMVEEMKKAQC